MDHSPIRQTFAFGKSISTAAKSILNFIQLSSLVAKYCKVLKIWPFEACEFCILLYYARKSVTTTWKCGNAFSRVTKSIQNSQTSKGYIFDILQCFTTKLHNFTKFGKLFPTVLELFSNLKVCLIGEWSIASGNSHIGMSKFKPGTFEKNSSSTIGPPPGMDLRLQYVYFKLY